MQAHKVISKRKIFYLINRYVIVVNLCSLMKIETNTIAQYTFHKITRPNFVVVENAVGRKRDFQFPKIIACALLDRESDPYY